MKAPKFDLAAIKIWLLNHGEKLALGVVGIVFLLFTYSALKRETLDAGKQPGKLQDLATTAQQRVSESRFDKDREKITVVNYQDRAISKKIEPVAFPTPTLWNGPIAAPKARREVPAVLAAEELRVAAGLNVMALRDPAKAPNAAPQRKADDGAHADSRLKVQPWVAVTALVQVVKQQEEYDRVFSRAAEWNPNEDVPLYAVPLLERAEVDPANPDKLEFKPVPAAREFEAQWEGRMEEIVSRKYTDPNLTAMLGPIVSGKWGESVAHPKVRLAADEADPTKAAAVEAPRPEAPAAAPAPPPAGEFQFNEQPKPAGPNPNAPAGGANDKQPEVIAVRLLRVFDYTAAVNKTYRYRVKLGVRNPNFEKSPRWLKDPESAKSPVLTSEWSAPTAAVTVPDGYGVLAGPVVGGSRVTEPSISLRVTTIDKKEGLNAAAEVSKAYRGSLANLMEQNVPARGPRGDVKELTMDFRSNTLVLDITGGMKLVQRGKEQVVTPGEVLLLDAQGNMSVRGELDDARQYESSMPAKEPPPKKEKEPNPLDTPKRKPRQAKGQL